MLAELLSATIFAAARAACRSPSAALPQLLHSKYASVGREVSLSNLRRLPRMLHGPAAAAAFAITSASGGTVGQILGVGRRVWRPLLHLQPTAATIRAWQVLCLQGWRAHSGGRAPPFRHRGSALCRPASRVRSGGDVHLYARRVGDDEHTRGKHWDTRRLRHGPNVRSMWCR